MLFLLILYIGNKASLAIKHRINWSLEMRYYGVPLYIHRVMKNKVHTFETATYSIGLKRI